MGEVRNQRGTILGTIDSNGLVTDIYGTAMGAVQGGIVNRLIGVVPGRQRDFRNERAEYYGNIFFGGEINIVVSGPGPERERYRLVGRAVATAEYVAQIFDVEGQYRGVVDVSARRSDKFHREEVVRKHAGGAALLLGVVP